MARLYRRAGIHPTMENASGHITWTTSGDQKSLQAVLTAEISIEALSVAFPDLLKGNAYYYDHYYPLGAPLDVCDSFITWLPQEWGPGRSIDLPVIELGTVPGGVDALDVQAKLVRTVAPTPVLGQSLLVIPKEGEWVSLNEGSCPLETLGLFSRGFDVVMSPYVNASTPRTVSLRRFQTVWQQKTVGWRGDNNGSDPAKDGWTYGGPAGAFYGLIVYHRDSRSGGQIGKFRAGGNACSLSDPTNFGATYSVSLRITPIRRS